jgi:anti-anti-sigma regulatory factor
VLDGHLREVRDAGFEQLVADLRGLTFIDSSGVQLMLRWSASAAELGHGFRILPGPRARAVFAITGTLDALGIEPVGDGRAAP